MARQKQNGSLRSQILIEKSQEHDQKHARKRSWDDQILLSVQDKGCTQEDLRSWKINIVAGIGGSHVTDGTTENTEEWVIGSWIT